MQQATIIVQKERHNKIFQPGAGPNGGEFFLPWRMLRERFAAVGYELNTPDLNVGKPVAFEFHLNAQRGLAQRPCYTYLYEDALVRPINARAAVLAGYRKVFTWNHELHGKPNVIALDYPNDLTVREVPSFDERDLWCVMIASNKALRYADARSLHGKRVEAIRHFEEHAPGKFALYGGGWGIPPVRPGAWGRILKRANEWRSRLLPSRPFPSWQGRISRKADVLNRAKFSICYENSRGSAGYITEKIMDCFTSGCVPVYIGSQRRPEALPSDCYIDGDQFESPAQMLSCLMSIDSTRFGQYQDAMRRFLVGRTSDRFSNENFCAVIVREIVADLRLTNQA